MQIIVPVANNIRHWCCFKQLNRNAPAEKDIWAVVVMCMFEELQSYESCDFHVQRSTCANVTYHTGFNLYKYLHIGCDLLCL